MAGGTGLSAGFEGSHVARREVRAHHPIEESGGPVVSAHRTNRFTGRKAQVRLAQFGQLTTRAQASQGQRRVGAREMAQNLVVRPQAVVVVDMVGDADQDIYYERYSTPELSAELWAIAADLGYSDSIIPEPKHTIIDDHLPFVEQGIPAVDIIDFDYPYWHTLEDTADKVSPTSLERVGRTLEVWLEGE